MIANPFLYFFPLIAESVLLVTLHSNVFMVSILKDGWKTCPVLCCVQAQICWPLFPASNSCTIESGKSTQHTNNTIRSLHTNWSWWLPSWVGGVYSWSDEVAGITVVNRPIDCYKQRGKLFCTCLEILTEILLYVLVIVLSNNDINIIMHQLGGYYGREKNC